jgi:trimeric autotransporter adhesin
VQTAASGRRDGGAGADGLASAARRLSATDESPARAPRSLGVVSAALSSISSALSQGAATLSAALLSLLSTAAARLRSIAPLPAAVGDRLPARALDSRVVSVNLLASGSSRRLAVPDTTALAGAAASAAASASSSAALPASRFRITVPLRDLSIVDWDATGASGSGWSPGVDIGTDSAFPRRAVNVTCPAAPAEALRAGRLAARLIAPPSSAGAATFVRVRNVTGVT